MTKWTIRGLVFTALFAAIMIALSFLKFALPFSPVPITFSTLGVMLAGTFLGARYGALAVLLVITLVAAGYPVLGGRGGISVLVGPTAGYIFAWPFAAFLIGWFSQRIELNKLTFIKLALINFLFGSLLLYPTGAGWLAYSTHMDSLSKVLTAGVWPFLPGDLFKALICAAVATAVWKVYPMDRLIGR
jgi:biotin transport system substrate-specific component